MTREKTLAVAETLVACCRENREAEALDTLYHADAVSAEAMPMPGSDNAEARGIEAIRGKHDWWNATFEVHGSQVEGPFLHGDDRFAVIFQVDATNSENGERFNMKEVALYFVADGKIVREEFYYTG